MRTDAEAFWNAAEEANRLASEAVLSGNPSEGICCQLAVIGGIGAAILRHLENINERLERIERL